jgi:hypothetical protein
MDTTFCIDDATCMSEATNDYKSINKDSLGDFKTNPVTILHQGGSIVMFQIEQTWTDDQIGWIAVNYPAADRTVYDTSCPYTEAIAAGDSTPAYTATCTNGIAKIDVFVYDCYFAGLDNIDSDVPPICQPWVDEGKKVHFKFTVPCLCSDHSVLPASTVQKTSTIASGTDAKPDPNTLLCGEEIFEDYEEGGQFELWNGGIEVFIPEISSTVLGRMGKQNPKMSRMIDVPSHAKSVSIQFDLISIGDMPGDDTILVGIQGTELELKLAADSSSPVSCEESSSTTNQAFSVSMGRDVTADGNISDWGNLQARDFMRMYEAGNPQKTLLSKAYMQYDGDKLCVLVMAEEDPPVYFAKSMSDCWIKDYAVGQNTMGPVEWVENDNGKIIGWEGCFTMEPGCHDMIEIHANTDKGQTTSTGKKMQNYSQMMLSNGAPVLGGTDYYNDIEVNKQLTNALGDVSTFKIKMKVPGDWTETGKMDFSVSVKTMNDINVESYALDNFSVGADCSRRELNSDMMPGSEESSEDGFYCLSTDFPCEGGEGMVHVCHYSAKLGYQTFCIPEADSEVLRFYMHDYCGPCVGGFGSVNMK